jgi:hypothetical protein
MAGNKARVAAVQNLRRDTEHWNAATRLEDLR